MVEHREAIQCQAVGGFCRRTHVRDGSGAICFHAHAGARVARSGGQFEAFHQNINGVLGLRARSGKYANLIRRNGHRNAADGEGGDAGIGARRGVGNGHQHGSQSLRVRNELSDELRRHPFYLQEQHPSQKDLS